MKMLRLNAFKLSPQRNSFFSVGKVRLGGLSGSFLLPRDFCRLAYNLECSEAPAEVTEQQRYRDCHALGKAGKWKRVVQGVRAGTGDLLGPETL